MGCAVAEGPIFPSDFNEIDDHIPGGYAGRRREEFANATEELAFLLRPSSGTQSDLHENDFFGMRNAEIATAEMTASGGCSVIT